MTIVDFCSKNRSRKIFFDNQIESQWKSNQRNIFMLILSPNVYFELLIFSLGFAPVAVGSLLEFQHHFGGCRGANMNCNQARLILIGYLKENVFIL